MPQLTIQVSEATGSGGVSTGTGPAFVAAPFDAGPPASGPKYVLCQSLSAVVNAFGARSSTSAAGYDWLDEFFHDSNGGVAYVTNVTDATATSATLTLNDGQGSPEPTVVVTAASAGAQGNLTYVTVTAGTAATFTATTTNSSTSLSAVSSFKDIAVGTKVTGTNIPANTYITAVNTGASTATLSNSATGAGSGVVITPATYTVGVIVLDASGNQIANETHGPYNTTAQLYADTSSAWVTFAQSAGSGFTVNQPATLASTALSGGANPNDLTDSSHVAALDLFPPSLGAGTVALPGKTGSTIWSGLLSHAARNNRFAALDMTDASTSAAAISAAQALTSSSNNSYGMFIQGSLLLPPIVAGATRTVAGSAAVAALFARVAQTNNQNQTPAGPDWPLSYPVGFTTFFGPVPVNSNTSGNFAQSDVNAFDQAGINCFANVSGELCLYGLVSPVLKTQDSTFWQFQAGRERMQLVSLFNAIGAPFLFKNITFANINNLHTKLAGAMQAEQTAGALYGDDGNPGFVVDTDAVNTPTTAQNGQMLATVGVRLVKGADLISLSLVITPITQQIAV